MSSHVLKLATAVVGLGLAGAALITTGSAGQRKGLVGDGVVHVKSVYPVEETVRRLKADIAAKGIMFFDDIDQGKLAASAGITLNPSRLLVFGNPPLGIQFLTADADAGLDWPVRLLVFENEQGEVWTAYTDFNWIAKRHNIRNRKPAFDMAAKVIGSITSSVAVK